MGLDQTQCTEASSCFILIYTFIFSIYTFAKKDKNKIWIALQYFDKKNCCKSSTSSYKPMLIFTDDIVAV